MSQLPLVVKTSPLPPPESAKDAVSLPGPPPSNSWYADNVYCVVELPDGERVATASGDGVVRVHYARTGKLLRKLRVHAPRLTLRSHTTGFHALAALGGNLIASSQEARGDATHPSFFVWSVDDSKPLSSLKGQAGLKAIAALGNGLLVLCPGKSIVVMKHSDGRALTEARRRNDAHASSIAHVTCCGGRIATASWDETVGVWDAETLVPLARLQGHSESVYSVILSEHVIVSASGDKSLRIYDSHSYCCTHVVEEAHASFVSSIALVNDRHCITFSRDETACVVNFKNGTVVARVRTGINAQHGAVLRDGQVAVVGLRGKGVTFGPPSVVAPLFRGIAAARSREPSSTGAARQAAADSLDSGLVRPLQEVKLAGDGGSRSSAALPLPNESTAASSHSPREVLATVDAAPVANDAVADSAVGDARNLEMGLPKEAENSLQDEGIEENGIRGGGKSKKTAAVFTDAVPEQPRAADTEAKKSEEDATAAREALAADVATKKSKEDAFAARDAFATRDALAADVAAKKEEQKKLERLLEELQQKNARAADESLRQKTADDMLSRVAAKKAAEYAARQAAEQEEIEKLIRKRELLRTETAAEEAHRQEQLRVLSASFGGAGTVRRDGQPTPRDVWQHDQRPRRLCTTVNHPETARVTEQVDLREGSAASASGHTGENARTALRELEMTRTLSGNNVVLFSMAGALASVPLDGGATAVTHGVALLLQAVSWVKGNLELMRCVPLAIEGLRFRLEGLERCLTVLQGAPNASPFLADYIDAAGKVLAESCQIVDDVVSEFKRIDRGGWVGRKFRVILGRGQKRCAETLLTLADRIQGVRDDLHFCISVDSNTFSRTSPPSQQHLPHDTTRMLSSIPPSARATALRGMQAIAAAACGAFGDVRMLLLALKTLVDQVPPTTAGVEHLLEKLEELSLSDVLAQSADNVAYGGTSGGAFAERSGIGDDEILALRDELRGPVEGLISAVAGARDEILSEDERALALEMLGCMWRPWRAVGRKDLTFGQRLGSGATGPVYAADWIPGGSGSSPICVAAKCIDVTGDESQRRQKVEGIEIEAGVMRDCKHSCIVKMYGVVLPSTTQKREVAVEQQRNSSHGLGMSFLGPSAGSLSASSRRILSIAERSEASDAAVIVMERMGGNVMRTLQMQALPSIQDRILVLRDTADGMAYLHSRGVAHLDLKPENILLNVELRNVGEEEKYLLFGRAKVCDFGTSRRTIVDTVQWALTRGVGTLEYMAPEMLKEARPTATVSCDVFSFGVMICALFGSEKSLKKYQEHSVQERVKMAAAGRLSKLLVQCIGSVEDDRVREVCQACVEDRPGERPNFERILEAMNAIVRNSGIDQIRSFLYM